jgi:hypothetical protein
LSLDSKPVYQTRSKTCITSRKTAGQNCFHLGEDEITSTMRPESESKQIVGSSCALAKNKQATELGKRWLGVFKGSFLMWLVSVEIGNDWSTILRCRGN